MCVLTEVGEEAAAEAQPAPPYEGSGEDKTAVPRPELDPRRPAEYEPAWERKEGIGRTLSGTDALLLFNSIGLTVTSLESAVRRLKKDTFCTIFQKRILSLRPIFEPQGFRRAPSS